MVVEKAGRRLHIPINHFCAPRPRKLHCITHLYAPFLYTLSTYVPPLTALYISHGRDLLGRVGRVWYSARTLDCGDYFEREHGFGNVGGLGRQRADGAGNPGQGHHGDNNGGGGGRVEGGAVARLGCECSNVRAGGRVAYGLTASTCP